MRFQKISITKKGVHLVRETTDGNGATEAIVLETPERPRPSFNDAVQAFKPYVVGLLEDAIEVDPAKILITTLNLSEDKNGNRGLIVTATVPVPKAYDKPLVLNMPLVREGKAELELEDAKTLDDPTLDLIKLVEAEAEKFVNGERLPASADAEKKKPSENSKEFDERAAAASAKSTRTPSSAKKGATKEKGKAAAPAAAGSKKDNTVKFPEQTAESVAIVSEAAIRQLLLSVDRDVPVEAIGKWPLIDRAAAVTWAEARQKELLGQLADLKVPSEPACVIKSSTLPLKADEWDQGAPVPITKAGAESIHAAATS